METWTTIDRSGWAQPKLCNGEPDKAQWIDKKSGFDCLIHRGPSGALCGYVGVPEAHPLYEQDASNLNRSDYEQIQVHGGLTFSNYCSPSEKPEYGICHTGEVANKKVWWFGFDCAHLGDICPKYDEEWRYPEGGGPYKDFDFVKRETEVLAGQLRSLAPIAINQE